MTPEEATRQLRAIHEMVQQSRTDRARTGDIYVAWGLVAVLGIAGQLGLDLAGSTLDWAAWLVVIPVGMGYSIWRGREEAGRRVTWASRVEARVWQLAMLAIGIACAAGRLSDALPLAAITSIVMAIVGLAVGTSAELYRARSLYLASAVFFAVAAVAPFLEWRSQLGLMGGALVVGYIVPGVIMMRAVRADG